jgi:hypothetical protein
MGFLGFAEAADSHGELPEPTKSIDILFYQQKILFLLQSLAAPPSSHC